MDKKVFISYARSVDDTHMNWVKDLGARLMADSIDVELDQWSLKDGHDINVFMETMVNSPNISRVLIICDENYKNKANTRSGGVGAETQIITPKIYENSKEEKFIPIVRERDKKGNAFLPTYLSSRLYIDFSDDEMFEDSYEKLLRNIADKPSIPKPKLGTKLPSYITDDSFNDSELKSIIRSLKNQIKRDPEKSDSFVADFIDLFLEELKTFEVKGSPSTHIAMGQEIYNNLMSYKIIRDDFIDFVSIITSKEVKVDVDELIRFFEQKLLFLSPQDDRSSWVTGQFDNFKAIFHELFIYSVASCLKNKNYKLIRDLLFSKYYPNDKHSKTEEKEFLFIFDYHRDLNEYISSQYNNTAGFGQYLMNNVGLKFDKNLIILADTICYIICQLYPKIDSHAYWYPFSYTYDEKQDSDFFLKLSSSRRFEEVKYIFNVETPLELKELLTEYSKKVENNNRKRYDSRTDIKFPHELIDKEKIAINL